MKQALLFVVFAGACLANVCTPVSTPANGPFPAIGSNGVDGAGGGAASGPSWSIARVQWVSDQSPGPAIARRVSYATNAEWAANPGVYPHVTAQMAAYGTYATYVTTSSSTQIQNGILSNLLPATGYHFLAQSNQGTAASPAWCTATDQTFTTLAKPAGSIIYPTLPKTVDTTRPGMTGTHWYLTNGGSTPSGFSACGTTTGSGVTIDTANIQDCLNKMVGTTGDDLTLPYRLAPYQISQVVTHTSELAVQVSCSTLTSSCTQSGSAPANGTQIIMGAYAQYGGTPTPINPGIPYYVVGSSGSNFQLSNTLGGTPIPLTTTGSSVGYLPWPLTQPKMVIHSSASASQLPPVGVRLGADALAQYYPYMPTIQGEDPTVTSFLIMPMTVNLEFENIRFASDPAVSAATSPLDPVLPNGVISSVYISNSGIIFDQCAISNGAAPNRLAGITLEGSNTAIINSYILTDNWKPSYFASSIPSNTSTVATIPASTWTYVNAGGTKTTCTNAGGTITISGGGSGMMPVWSDSNCTWEVQTPIGVTATSTVPGVVIKNLTSVSVTNVGTAGSTSYSYAIVAHYPTYNLYTISATTSTGSATLSGTNYNSFTFTPDPAASAYDIVDMGNQALLGTITTSGSTSPQTFHDTGAGGSYFPPSNFTGNNYPYFEYTSPFNSAAHRFTNATLNLWSYTVSSGVITDTSASISGNLVNPGESRQSFEGASGISIDAWGPTKIDNNYILGSGILGPFQADGLTLSNTPCQYENGGNPCQVQWVSGNLSITRNTMTIDTDHWLYDSPDWDGGNRYWRNLAENKSGRYSLYDGNVLGPYSGQVGEGQCFPHSEFANQFIQVGSYPPYVDSSDFTFSNNTCWQLGETGLGGAYNFQGPYIVFPYPMKNFLFQNDLFLNNNGYAQVQHNLPFKSDGHVINSTASGQCPQGTTSGVSQQENFVWDHVTIIGSGGCQPFWFEGNNDFASGGITNSVINILGDTGPFAPYFGTSRGGMYFTSNGYRTDSCANYTTVAAYFNCVNNWTWAGNIMLATWSNSYPGAQTDYATSDVSALQASFGSYTANWPNANTLASREAQIGWFNTSTGNFRFVPSSPYISGNIHGAASPTTDGNAPGVDMDQLEQHQGKISNIRVLSKTSTSLTLAWFEAGYPTYDQVGVVQWGTTAFYSGTGTWTPVTATPSASDGRQQSVTLTGLPADALIYLRVNGAVMQPTLTVQLP